MKDLTIIIPVHKYNTEVNNLLENLIKSIEVQEEHNEKINLLFVFPKKIEKEIKSFFISEEKLTPIKPKYLINNGDISYQHQVNLAVDNINTKYFTVLEFDDEISNTYLKNVKKHIDYYSDVDVFMCLIIETNEKNEAIKITNEMVWSQHSVGEKGVLGFLNQETMKMYTDFKLSGAVIKTKPFKEIGKYKTKIKLAFMYEFLLRALHNGLKIMTIPKVIYNHLMNRHDSLFETYLREMDVSERRFWFETAKKEYNFNNDRDISIDEIKRG